MSSIQYPVGTGAGRGGSTILGSGEVALIIDVQSLVSRSAKSEEQAVHGTTGMRRLEVH